MGHSSGELIGLVNIYFRLDFLLAHAASKNVLFEYKSRVDYFLRHSPHRFFLKLCYVLEKAIATRFAWIWRRKLLIPAV